MKLSRKKATEGEWVNGYGSGITGPTTPSVSGPTVRESIEYHEWDQSGGKGQAPKNKYTIVSVGTETIAILPFQEGKDGEAEAKANARLIAAAPALLAACNSFIEVFDNEQVLKLLAVGLGEKFEIWLNGIIRASEVAITKAEK